MRVRRSAERDRRRRILAVPEIAASPPCELTTAAHISSTAVDVDEVVYCVLDSLVDGKAETERAATSTILRFARLQQDFTIRAILYFLEVQKTTESHQHALLVLLRKCITQSHETIPTGLLRDVLLFMLKELNFLGVSDVRHSVIIETVNETAVLCPAFSVEVILAFIRDLRQESAIPTETLCIYIRVLTHVFAKAANNDYIRSVDVVGQILSLYDPSTICVESGELCKNLVSLLCTLSKALHPLQEWQSAEDAAFAQVSNQLVEALSLEDVAHRRFAAWHARYRAYRLSVDKPQNVQSETMPLNQLGALIDGSSPEETDVLWSSRSAEQGSQQPRDRPVVRSVRLGSRKRIISFAAALYASRSLCQHSEQSSVGLRDAENPAVGAPSSTLTQTVGRHQSSMGFDSAIGAPNVADGNAWRTPTEVDGGAAASNQLNVQRSASSIGTGQVSKEQVGLGLASQNGFPSSGSMFKLAALGMPMSEDAGGARHMPHQKAGSRNAPRTGAHMVLQTLSGPMGIPTVGVPAGFHDVLAPLFTLLLERSLASIYTNPPFTSTCLEALFAMALLSKHVSDVAIARYGLSLLDSVLVRFYQYLPNTPYQPVARQGRKSVWMSLHKESSDTYRNKIVTIFSSLGSYGDKITMLPPAPLVMCLLHLCKVLLRRRPHIVVCQLPNICEVLFGLLIAMHGCGKVALLASCDSSFVSYYIDEEDLLLNRSVGSAFLDVGCASSCKDFVRTVVAACRFMASSVDTRCYFLEFLFRKALKGSPREVTVALFMLGWSCSHPPICEALTDSRRRSSAPASLGVSGAVFWRLIDVLHTLLGRMPAASAHPHTLRLLLALINHLSRGDWLLLHCLVGYRTAPNYPADFYPENAAMRITRPVYALIDFVFSLKVVYDLEKRIGENNNKVRDLGMKLASGFFRKMYCGQHATSYDLSLLVCGSRSFEKFLLPHCGDPMITYLLQLLLTNSKMSVFTVLRSLSQLFAWGNAEAFSGMCSTTVFTRAMAFVLVYLHDPVNYFGEAFAAAKVLPYLSELVLGERLELCDGTRPKSHYCGLDSYVLSFDRGDCYGHLSGVDHIVLHFEKVSRLFQKMVALSSFESVAVVMVNQLARICQSLKPPTTTYASLLKLSNVQASSSLTMYHRLGILHIMAACSRCSVDLCSSLIDFLLGFRGQASQVAWDAKFSSDSGVPPFSTVLGKWAPLTLNVCEQMRYTMLQLHEFNRHSAQAAAGNNGSPTANGVISTKYPENVDRCSEDISIDLSLQDDRLYFTVQADDYLHHESQTLRGLILGALGMHQQYYHCVLWKVYYGLRSRLPGSAVIFTKFATLSFGEDLKVVALTALAYLYARAPANLVDAGMMTGLHVNHSETAYDTERPTPVASPVSRYIEQLATPTDEAALVDMYTFCFREGCEKAVCTDLAGDNGLLRCVVAPMLFFLLHETDIGTQHAVARALHYVMRAAKSNHAARAICRFPYVALNRVLYFVASLTSRDFAANQLYDPTPIRQQCAHMFNRARWDLNFPAVRAFESAPLKPAADGVTCSNVALAFFSATCLLSDYVTSADDVLPVLHLVLSFGDVWEGLKRLPSSSSDQLSASGSIDVKALTVRFMKNCVAKAGWKRLSQVLSMALFMSEGFPAGMVEHRVSLVLGLLSDMEPSSVTKVHEDDFHSGNNIQGSLEHTSDGSEVIDAVKGDSAPLSATDHVETGLAAADAQQSAESSPQENQHEVLTVQNNVKNAAKINAADDGEEEHWGFVDCVLLLWAHMLHLEYGSKMREALHACLKKLLCFEKSGQSLFAASEDHLDKAIALDKTVAGPAGQEPFVTAITHGAQTALNAGDMRGAEKSEPQYSNIPAVTTEVGNKTPSKLPYIANVERIDLLIPKGSLMMALLCCMKYLSASSCLSGPFANILQLILQQRYSDLDHQHLESILATIFSNFSSSFESHEVPCSTHNFVVDLAQTDFEVLCNVIFAPNCNYSKSFKLSVTALITHDPFLTLQLLDFLERCMMAGYQHLGYARHSVSMDYIMDFVGHIYVNCDAGILHSDEGVRFVTTLVIHSLCITRSNSRDSLPTLQRLAALVGQLGARVNAIRHGLDAKEHVNVEPKGMQQGNGNVEATKEDNNLRRVASKLRRSCRSLVTSSESHQQQFLRLLDRLLHCQNEFKRGLLSACLSILCNLLREKALRRYTTAIIGIIKKIGSLKELRKFYYRSVHYFLLGLDGAECGLYTHNCILKGYRRRRAKVNGSIKLNISADGDDVYLRTELLSAVRNDGGANSPTTALALGAFSKGRTENSINLLQSLLDELTASLMNDLSKPPSVGNMHCLERAASSLIRFVTESRGYRVRDFRALVAQLLRMHTVLIGTDQRVLCAFAELYLAIADWLESCISRGYVMPVEVQRHLLPPLGLSILHGSVSMRSQRKYRRLTRVLAGLLSDAFPIPLSVNSSSRGWLKSVLLRRPFAAHSKFPYLQLCMCGCNNPELTHTTGERFCVCHAFYLLDLFSSCFPSYCWNVELGMTENIDSEIARLRRDEHVKRTSQVLFGSLNDFTPSQSLVLGDLGSMSRDETFTDESGDFVDISSAYKVRVEHYKSGSQRNALSNMTSSQSLGAMMTARSMRSSSFNNAYFDHKEYNESHAVDVSSGRSGGPLRAMSADSKRVGIHTQGNIYTKLLSLSPSRSFDNIRTVASATPREAEMPLWLDLSLPNHDAKRFLYQQSPHASRGVIGDESQLNEEAENESPVRVASHGDVGVNLNSSCGSLCTSLDVPIDHVSDPSRVSEVSTTLQRSLMFGHQYGEGPVGEASMQLSTSDLGDSISEIDASPSYGYPQAELSFDKNRIRLNRAKRDVSNSRGSSEEHLSVTGSSRSALSYPLSYANAGIAEFSEYKPPVLVKKGLTEEIMKIEDSLIPSAYIGSLRSLSFRWPSRKRSLGKALNSLPCLPSLLPILTIADFQVEIDGHLRRINVFNGERKNSLKSFDTSTVGQSLSFFDISNLECIWNTTLYTSPMVYRFMLLSKYLNRPKIYACIREDQGVSRPPPGQGAVTPTVASPYTAAQPDRPASLGCDQPQEPTVPESVMINAVRGAAAILHMALLHLTNEEVVLRQHIVDKWPRCFLEMARYNAVLHFEALAQTVSKQLCKMLEGSSGLLKRVLLESMEMFAVVLSSSNPDT
ncbi:hypothetical protein, conserved [Babesia bigemina]|uniref:Uncharacterized protein n=1 Tax=Babesia bigemina TaxID=5866 RepID=A0A061D9I0_BABBI|nr:hypothetical protein, conserved [Babesia bigemina]CDR95584.1 hypothetical protein, conserved [Babesia bigemina]|eukprot:XP_012767770.1 hypothetical protein, conserved [Babesia bigemina]